MGQIGVKEQDEDAAYDRWVQEQVDAGIPSPFRYNKDDEDTVKTEEIKK